MSDVSASFERTVSNAQHNCSTAFIDGSF